MSLIQDVQGVEDAMRKPTYSLYRDDELIGIRTAAELAAIHGVKPRTIQRYATPTARKQGLRTLAYRMEDDDE